MVRTLWNCTFWFFFFWAASLDSFRQRKWKLWQQVICPGCAASCPCQQLGASAARGNYFIISTLFIFNFSFLWIRISELLPEHTNFYFTTLLTRKSSPSIPHPSIPAVNLSLYLVIVELSATIKYRLCWIICKLKRTKKKKNKNLLIPLLTL